MSTTQDSPNTFKPNLACIFLSVRVNWNINIWPWTPCIPNILQTRQFNRNRYSILAMSTNLVVWVWLLKFFLDLAENLIEPDEQEEIVGQFKDHHARLYRKRGIKHPSVSKFFGHRQICYIWYSVKYKVCFNYKTLFRPI